jgi:hypothetical protein
VFALISALPAVLSGLRARIRTLLSDLQPRVQTLLRAARSVSAESALHRLASAFRSLRSASPESARRSLESALHSMRSVTAKSLARDAQRLARRPSRLTLGVTAGTVLAIAAIAAAVSSGSAPAAALSDTASHAAPVAAGPVGHAPATGQAPAAGFTPAAGDAPAGHAPAGHAAAGHAAAGHAPARHAAAGHAAAGHAPARHAAWGHAPKGHVPAGRTSPGHAPAGHARTGHAVSHAAAAPAKPYSIYDSVTPSAIPSSQKSVATYATGPFAASASQVAGKKVTWIDTHGYDYKASALDIEPGDATPSVAASWAWHRLHAHPHAIARLYTMISEWPAVKSAVASFPAQMRDRIHYWIADPTGTPHLVPGSDATQWYWGSNYDITTASPGF